MFTFFLIVALTTLFCILLQPLAVVFTKEQITILYTLGTKEIIPIDQITSVYQQGSLLHKGSGFPVYVVTYPHQKRRFFENGALPRTNKTKELLNTFCQKSSSKGIV